MPRPFLKAVSTPLPQDACHGACEAARMLAARASYSATRTAIRPADGAAKATSPWTLIRLSASRSHAPMRARTSFA